MNQSFYNQVVGKDLSQNGSSSRINLKKKINKYDYIKNKILHGKKKSYTQKKIKLEGGRNWEIGIDTYTLSILCIK